MEMNMLGREYLDLAREIIVGGAERHFGGAVGRAYYALMLECRDALLAWGFTIPPRDNVHTFTRLRFTFVSDPGLLTIRDCLDYTGRLRNEADYHLISSAVFSTVHRARRAIDDVATALGKLDAINADPAYRTAAIAEVRSRWP